MMSDPEYARWLPAEQVVFGADGTERTFERRLFAEILPELTGLAALPNGEPFIRALMHERVEAPQSFDLDELIARAGPDAVRLALLHGASPARAFRLDEQALRPGERFLERLHAYAEERLRAWAANPGADAAQAQIDSARKLRRRLAHWCEVARVKVTAQLEALELQHATHNAMLLLTRIQDFEARTAEHGELDELDREAVVAALLVLATLLAPLAPRAAEELQSAAAGALAG